MAVFVLLCVLLGATSHVRMYELPSGSLWPSRWWGRETDPQMTTIQVRSSKCWGVRSDVTIHRKVEETRKDFTEQVEFERSFEF